MPVTEILKLQVNTISRGRPYEKLETAYEITEPVEEGDKWVVEHEGRTIERASKASAIGALVGEMLAERFES